MDNDLRNDIFRRMMTFSFPQLDRSCTGMLLTFGSMYFMFRLNAAFGLTAPYAFWD